MAQRHLVAIPESAPAHARASELLASARVVREGFARDLGGLLRSSLGLVDGPPGTRLLTEVGGTHSDELVVRCEFCATTDSLDSIEDTVSAVDIEARGFLSIRYVGAPGIERTVELTE